MNKDIQSPGGTQRALPATQLAFDHIRVSLAELDEFQDKLKEVEGVAAPLIAKMYRQQQGGGEGGEHHEGA
eukprot:5443992-Pyramimonas_sp.AAC.1